jgi:hypothetical protein
MAREDTSQPPGIKSWGDKCEEENQQGHTLAGTGNQGAVEVPAAQHLKVAIGTRVECLFKSEDDPDGTWFGGVVTSRREDGLSSTTATMATLEMMILIFATSLLGLGARGWIPTCQIFCSRRIGRHAGLPLSLICGSSKCCSILRISVTAQNFKQETSVTW